MAITTKDIQDVRADLLLELITTALRTGAQVALSAAKGNDALTVAATESNEQLALSDARKLVARRALRRSAQINTR